MPPLLALVYRCCKGSARLLAWLQRLSTVGRPAEVKQALRTALAYVEQLEKDLAAERRARQLLELKLKAAQAAAAPRTRPEPSQVVGNDPRQAALQLLGLVGNPSGEDVRRAYRRRARELHPDAPDGSDELFHQLTAAMELLLNGRC